MAKSKFYIDYVDDGRFPFYSVYKTIPKKDDLELGIFGTKKEANKFISKQKSMLKPKIHHTKLRYR